jgi:hypothetical protein
MVAVAFTNAGTSEIAATESRIARPGGMIAIGGAEHAAPASALEAALAETTPDTRPATGLMVAVLASLPLWALVVLAGRALLAGF